MSESDLSEWAESVHRTLSGYHRCQTCRHVEAAKVIDDMISVLEPLADSRGGFNAVSLPVALTKLRELVPSYSLQKGAFRSHLEKCRPGAWEKLWKGGGR